MEKKILEFHIDEKDGEYVIRVKGEKAEKLMKSFPMMCRCCCHVDKDDKAAAECC
jgi:hypothetical protein